MKRMQAAMTGMVLAVMALQATAADVLKPRKITAAFAAGPAFKDPAAAPDPDDKSATDLPIGASSDGRFQAGLYKAGASDTAIAAYSEDEFCYLLKGSVTLTSADGTKLILHPHEAAFIPKGWKGRWTTKGYTKYYAVYDNSK